MKKLVAAGVIHGNTDNLVRPIRECVITEPLDDGFACVIVRLKGEDKTQQVFKFLPEELNFGCMEFVGLSIPQALALKRKKSLDFARGLLY